MSGADLAFTTLRAYGYTGHLGDMLAAWETDFGVTVASIAGAGAWDAYWTAGLKSIATLISEVEAYFDEDYTTTPWVNQGTGGAFRDLAVAGDATASAGKVIMGGTTGSISDGAGAGWAVEAGEDATICLIGVFDFATRNFAVGSRSSSTSTLSNQGLSMAFRSNTMIRAYASDGVTIVGGTDVDVSDYDGVLTCFTLRFDRTTGYMQLRANGTDIGSAVDISGLGELEATSSFNIGTASFPGEGDVHGVVSAKSLLTDGDIGLIERTFGAV